MEAPFVTLLRYCEPAAWEWSLDRNRSLTLSALHCFLSPDMKEMMHRHTHNGNTRSSASVALINRDVLYLILDRRNLRDLNLVIFLNLSLCHQILNCIRPFASLCHSPCMSVVCPSTWVPWTNFGSTKAVNNSVCWHMSFLKSKK